MQRLKERSTVKSSKPSAVASVPRAVDALVVCLLFGSLAPVIAARQGPTQLRTVHGTVIDASNSPVSGAVVYLKNMTTRAVRTYFSSAQGRYHFSGLDPNVNYQIHAEHQDFTSTYHTVSSFDSHPDIVIELKVDRKKPAR
jgi:hypothetical protein